MKDKWSIVAIGAFFVWIGLVIGISFVEAPLKFQAPGITRELGLGIGKIVFSVLNKLELVLAGVVALGLWHTQKSRRVVVGFWVVVLLLAIQSVYLLPQLMHRADAFIGGASPPKTYDHLFYALCEGLKFLILLLSAVWFTGEQIGTSKTRHSN